MFFEDLEVMKQKVLKDLQRDVLIVCSDYALQNELIKEMQAKGSLFEGQVMSKADFYDECMTCDHVKIKDIKRYISLYASIPEDIKSEYNLKTYQGSEEYLQNVLTLFEELKHACTTIRKVKESGDDSLYKIWQEKPIDNLIRVYDAYRDYLEQKGYTDAIYMGIECFDAHFLRGKKKIIFYNIVEFSKLDKEIFKEITMSGIEIDFYVQGNEDLFEFKPDELKLRVKKDKESKEEKPFLSFPSKGIKLFEAKNAFGMHRQLLNEIEADEIDLIIDFDVDRQPFYGDLNSQYFFLKNDLSFNHSAIFNFLDQIKFVVERIVIDKGRKLIPIYALYHWFANHEFWRYIGKAEEFALRQEMNRFLLDLNERDWVYLDLDKEYEEAEKILYYNTNNVKYVLTSAFNIIKTFLGFKRFDELLDYLCDWQKNKLLSMLNFADLDPKAEYNNIAELEIYLEAIDNLRSITQLGMPENIDQHLPSVYEKLGFIIEYMHGKSYKQKVEESTKRTIRISDFADANSCLEKNIAILNLQESVLPSARKTPYLLTNAQREKLGLKSWDDIRLLEKYQFYIMINNSKSAKLFYIENVDDNTQKSSFVEEILQYRKDLIEAKLKLDDIDYQDYFAKTVKKNDEYIIPDKAVLIDRDFYKINDDDLMPDELKLGYYSYAQLKKNSFNWYFDLHCYFSLFSEVKEPQISYKALGNLVHNVFEELTKDDKYKEISEDKESVKMVEDAFDRAMQDSFYYKIDKGFDGDFFNLFLKKTISKNICKFIKEELIEKEAKEVKPEEEFAEKPVEGSEEGSLIKTTLIGRVDLFIEYLESIALIDIKTGSGAKEQLDFYLYLLGEHSKDVNAKIYNVIEGGAKYSEQLKAAKFEEFSEKKTEEIKTTVSREFEPAKAFDLFDRYRDISRQDDFVTMSKKKGGENE